MSELFKAMNTTSTTDNGCKTNHSSLSACLDLFFVIGSSRGKDISNLFSAAYAEDKDLAIRTILWARDVREGAGERATFKTLLTFLQTMASEDEVAGIIHKIPELGRFDDLECLFGTRYETHAVETWVRAIQGGNQLAAKWAPVKDKKGAKPLRKMLGLNEAQWRKKIVALRETVEQKMCAKEWKRIDYSKLPSLASSRYMTAFHRNDEQRYQEYKDALTKGEATINAGAVYPYDIIKGLKNSIGNEVVANKQWEALPDYVSEGENFLPVVDVSGSMSCHVAGNNNLSCMDVAISLGLYLSERNKGLFKDVFMTFSGRPQLCKTQGTLQQRYSQMKRAEWGMNTDIQAVFETLLSVARERNLPESEMPTKILIVSDMQFDSCIYGGTDVSMYEMAKAHYEASGYKLPQIVFWQVNASQGNVPATQGIGGTALVSGFSPSIMKSLLKGDLEPTKIMLDTIMSDRYKI